MPRLPSGGKLCVEPQPVTLEHTSVILNKEGSAQDSGVQLGLISGIPVPVGDTGLAAAPGARSPEPLPGGLSVDGSTKFPLTEKHPPSLDPASEPVSAPGPGMVRAFCHVKVTFTSKGLPVTP